MIGASAVNSQALNSGTQCPVITEGMWDLGIIGSPLLAIT